VPVITKPKIKDLYRKRVLVCSLLSISVCFLFAGIFWVVLGLGTGIAHNRAQDHQALRALSERLEIEPDWHSVREYLYCDALQVGLTRQEVVVVLKSIGTSNWNMDDESNRVNFSDPYIDRALGPLYVFFSHDGRLYSWTAREGNFGPKASCEYKK